MAVRGNRDPWAPMSSSVVVAQAGTDLEQIADSGISDVTSEEWLFAAVIVIVTIVVGMVGRRLIERAIRGRGHPTLCHLGGRFAQTLILLVGLFYAARSIDIAVGPLLGGLGIVGIALAFALQDFIANFAAGILLQARRPVRIGDQIVTNELQGEVEDVNFRSVKLRSFDGEIVYVPNMMVITNPITNWTKVSSRRTQLVVGVAYDTDLELARRVLADAVASVEGVEHEPRPLALATEFGESSINITLLFWHGVTIVEAYTARDGAVRAIKQAVNEAGITIAFPQRTVWFGADGPEVQTA